MTAKERVEQELQELQARLRKLEVFTKDHTNNPNHIINQLPQDQRRLLLVQLSTMQDYEKILIKRLELWSDLSIDK